jgi:hypothetical protein
MEATERKGHGKLVGKEIEGKLKLGLVPKEIAN